MNVTVLKLRPGVSFVQFGRTWGGNLRFTADSTPGAPGSQVSAVVATARPDLAGVLLETTLINKYSGKVYNPYVVPFESIDGFEVDAESLMAAHEVALRTVEPGGAAGPSGPAQEKRKPGRPPKIVAALALAIGIPIGLLAFPAHAADAGSDQWVHPLKSIVCYDAPAPGCKTCIHLVTNDFEIACGLPLPEKPKKKKKDK